MSTADWRLLDRKPLVALLERAARVMREELLRHGHESGGYTQIRMAHNAVFATLPPEGARASDMAARAGITKQSMGEAIREMTALGLLETQPDPEDRRAKLVTYTAAGRDVARFGQRYLASLEKRFAEEFGDEEYETVRDVLERVIGMFTAE